MMKSKLRAVVVAAAGILAITTQAEASPVTTPTGLNPGDTYRLAFITSVTRDATSANIADYNAFVSGVANANTELAALGTTWTAIASTTTVDARDNTGTNPFTNGAGLPIYLLDGSTKIADDNADLWDSSIDNPLNIDESGNTFNTLVWAGTVGSGSAAGGDLFGGPLGSVGFGGIEQGDSSATGVTWINIDDVPIDATGLFSMYALSGELTVQSSTAISAPGSALAFGIVFAGLMLKRRCRLANVAED